MKAMLLLVDCKEKIISDPSLSSCVNKNKPNGALDFDLALDYGEVGESEKAGTTCLAKGIWTLACHCFCESQCLFG